MLPNDSIWISELGELVWVAIVDGVTLFLACPVPCGLLTVVSFGEREFW